MKNFVIMFFSCILFAASFSTSYAEDAAFLTTTIEDIGRPYSVLDGACVSQQFPGLSFSGDRLQKSVDEAFKKMASLAKKLGADALVGFDVDYDRHPDKGEGRVLLCGTLVKFKD